ncbi:MAG: hypothetical protein ACREBG_15650 [Pyrinomonadaceae bacterium]
MSHIICRCVTTLVLIWFFFPASAEAQQPLNVALAANGATSSASSSYSYPPYNLVPANAINGDRKGVNFSWWTDDTSNNYPDWMEVQFSAAKSLTQIDVIGLQQNYTNPVEPTLEMTSSYALTEFEVQYWTGSSWTAVPGGVVSGNDKVWRRFTFTPLVTSKIRVFVSNVAGDNHSQIVELEAYEAINVALAANGANASASSTFGAQAPAHAINGDRKGLSSAWWADNTSSVYPDWIQVDFAGTKTINEIDVFGLQQNPSNPVEPTLTMTSSYALTNFEVQYWTGTAWAAVPGGAVIGNDKVWRKFTFAALTTSKIRVFVTNVAGDNRSQVVELEAYGAAVPSAGPDSNVARLEPNNRTGANGDDPLSRNFNWSVPLIQLPGRAGLDLGLSLSYNSLVWTKYNSSNSFDDDRGFPSPGFRLGFPVIQPPYFNSEVGKYAYLLITPDGERVELRQVGTTLLYEAGDSSYLLLDTGAMILRSTDGTQLTFRWQGFDYQCTEIKDRNGNFITINYTATGQLDTVVDTLNRTIKFNYENGYLKTISQTWTVNSAPVTHTWATFDYLNPNLSMQTNFPGLTVNGPPNGSTIKVLSKVTFNDASHFDFDYTSWGQVWKISQYADGNPNDHLLNYRSYNLPLTASSAQSDCPRFTERRDWARYWNGDTNGTPTANEEAITSFIVPVASSWTMPDGTPQTGTLAQVTVADSTSQKTTQKIYYAGTAGTSSGWQRRLPKLVETYDSANTLQRQSATTWEQDTNVPYQLNPRVTETNIYDPSGNRKRTQFTYQQFTFANGTSCFLPQDIYEYQANATTKLRSTRTSYNTLSDYTNRRIIGLVSEKNVYEGDVGGTLMSKVGFEYDQTGEGTDAPVQHDNASYGTGFLVGRGNLTSVKRYDVVNTSQSVPSTMTYNTAGSVVQTTDPSSHSVTLSYTDKFAQNGIDLDSPLSFATLAYPTTVTDADGYSSSIRYNYDFGGQTWKQTPLPNTIVNTAGPRQKISYDSVGRVEQMTNLENNAYTQFNYGPNYVESFTTVNNLANEARSLQIFDGAGRVIAKASNHPTISGGGSSGQRIYYDVLGRAISQSNPTDTSVASTTGIPIQPYEWQATGDDATAGWVYTLLSYDWKGRPLITTNPSITGIPSETTTKEASYAGCGCAGGEVVTLTDEGTIDAGVAKRRQLKIYSDVLGRTVKTELLNWQGGTVYSATVNTYNARNQVTQVRQYAGPEGSGTYQDTTMTYDGHGRLWKRHVPEQQVDPNNSSSTDHTTWEYFDDDTTKKITDARGASQTFGYNNRHLVNTVAYAAPSPIPTPSPVTYDYDAAGNRISMADGSGNTTYVYNSLSQLESETRQFSGPGAPPGTYTLSYVYNFAGELKKITDPTNATINYNYDAMGRMIGITGENTLYNGVSQYASGLAYRAWGGLKSMAYGNTTSLSLSYNQRGLVTHYSVDGVKLSGTTQIVPEGGDFQYYADGQPRFASDLRTDATAFGLHDRAYSFDHVGRLKDAYSGTEARDFVNGVNSGIFDGAFRQTSGYDAWGNLTSRTGRFWSLDDNSSDSYNSQNRNPSWEYDADGRLVSRNEPSLNGLAYQPLRFTYEAAGRRVQSTQTTSRHHPNPNVNIIFTTVRTRTETYDGDGVGVKSATTSQTNGGTIVTTSTFYLRSTVLGGRTISEYDAAGIRQKAYVFAGGELLAEQQRLLDGTTRLLWQHINPLTGDGLNTDVQGMSFARATLDPTGVDLGDNDPFPIEGGGGGEGEGLSQSGIDAMVAQLIPGFGGPQVKLDGFITSPHLAFSALSIGAAEFAPSQMYVGIYSRSQGRYVGLARWDANAAAAGVGVGTRGLHGLDNRGHNTGWVWVGQTFSTQNGVGGISVGGTWHTLGDYGYSPRYAMGGNPQNSRIRDVTPILNKIRFLGDNVNKPELKSMLQSRLMLLLTKGCAEAFKRAGLATPEEIINKGYTIASSPLLNDPSNNDTLGISESIRREAVKSQAPAQTIRPQFTSKGPITFFRAEAFADLDYLDEAVAHEFIHAAAVDKFPLWGYSLGRGHDLSGYEHYQDIIANCRYWR